MNYSETLPLQLAIIFILHNYSYQNNRIVVRCVVYSHKSELQGMDNAGNNV